MRANRKHRYDDYTYDESSVSCEKVKITNIHSCNGSQEIGYISRYSTKEFRFSSVGCGICDESEILNYKDWKIEYIK